jgi:hypothetical protein
MKRTYASIAAATLAIGTIALTASETSAILTDPPVGPTIAAPSVSEWPDEGGGYPGSGGTTSEYNYPAYDPRYEVPLSSATPVAPDDGLEATSVTLGALGGIALGAAAFGIALGAQRRRDHAASPQLR